MATDSLQRVRVVREIDGDEGVRLPFRHPVREGFDVLGGWVTHRCAVLFVVIILLVGHPVREAFTVLGNLVTQRWAVLSGHHPVGRHHLG